MSLRASRRSMESRSPTGPARPEGAPGRARPISAALPSQTSPKAAAGDASPAAASTLTTPATSATPEQLDAFARQFVASYRTLWTIAAGIVNDPVVAEDVVQDAAVTAMGKLNEFRPDSNFTAWMAQIVRYIALNASRRGRRQPAALDPTTMDDSISRPGASASPNEQHAAVPGVGSAGDVRGTPLVDSRGQLDARRTPFDDRVMRALNSVGEVARACLLLRTIEGLNYDEIARALEIPPGTAMSHVHRTRLFLRERLADLEPLRGANNTADTADGGPAV
jgi:RNA polymerase sigma-70 factor, ECF subfamily